MCFSLPTWHNNKLFEVHWIRLYGENTTFKSDSDTAMTLELGHVHQHWDHHDISFKDLANAMSMNTKTLFIHFLSLEIHQFAITWPKYMPYSLKARGMWSLNYTYTNFTLNWIRLRAHWLFQHFLSLENRSMPSKHTWLNLKEVLIKHSLSLWQQQSS